MVKMIKNLIQAGTIKINYCEISIHVSGLSGDFQYACGKMHA